MVARRLAPRVHSRPRRRFVAGGDHRTGRIGPPAPDIGAGHPRDSQLVARRELLTYDSSDVGLDDPTFRTTLWQIGADGSDAALLGDSDTFDVEPRVSPDGGQVAFVRWHPEADFASETVVRDIVSGDERVVVPLGVAVEHPEWSPDGSSLIFNAPDSAPDAGTIYTLDLNAPEAAPVILLDPSTGDGWKASSQSTPRTAHTSCSSATRPTNPPMTASASWTPTAQT